ncbi:protein-disulfide reductase DsbD family protein [Flavobacteriales bacterium]|nr:protein-disulfide reductase DsbD family protein [Flavobacteriales bacterium]
MKSLYSLFVTLLITLVSFGQIQDPVKWNFELGAVVENEVDLILTATIEEGWHMYAQDAGEGPVSTNFTFFENTAIQYIGNVNEGIPQEEYDPNFESVLRYFETKAVFTQRIKLLSNESSIVKGEFEFMVCNSSMCLPPEWVDVEVVLPAAQLNDSSSSSKSSSTDEGVWSIFIIAFLSGFIALLTPCVFPMIPMTVSFFTKQSKNKASGIKNALIYGLSIIGIYVVLGVFVSAVFGADALNNMATNVYFNLAFFVLLIVFAASFLGAFELTMPSSWINKADSASDRGGLLGIFFMAFTLALVSFSCTGPIVGTLLVEAASGGSYIGPIIGMFGFSLAIALPFAFFAAFPGWLNSLPKSGGWLNSVKVVLGFLELALAFKFLSNADLVLDLHILERETFISIWIVIFGLLTMYLLGKLKLSHDSDVNHLSVGRLFMAIITGAFTVYMIPGLWGAPLKLISAFPPPQEYSESPYGVGYTLGGEEVVKEEGQHLGPQGIMAFHDYDEGMAYATSVNKPVMLDFTGKACVNCRKMEQGVWSDTQIKNILKNEVVLISLYVDDRKKLPTEDQYETTLAGKTKKVRTIGDKWMVLQANTYQTNSQPYYVMLDRKAQPLLENANYQDYGSVAVFKDWLNRGLLAFTK